MITRRKYYIAAMLPNDLVLVSGGNNNSGIRDKAELHNASTGNWTSTRTMKSLRNSHVACALTNGKV